MADIILKGLKIREKNNSKVLTEEYRENTVEVLVHLTKLRNKKFNKRLMNGKKFKIIVRKSKLPDYEAPWVRTEDCVLKAKK